MFERIKNYIKLNEVKVTYSQNKINIVNYKKINIFDNNKIEINCFNKMVTINGNDLIITRLFNDELLIEGEINSIFFGESND